MPSAGALSIVDLSQSAGESVETMMGVVGSMCGVQGLEFRADRLKDAGWRGSFSVLFFSSDRTTLLANKLMSALSLSESPSLLLGSPKPRLVERHRGWRRFYRNTVTPPHKTAPQHYQPAPWTPFGRLQPRLHHHAAATHAPQ
jgi:hypothetical protein